MAVSQDPLKVSELVTSQKQNFNTISDDSLKNVTTENITGALSNTTSSVKDMSIPNVANQNSYLESTSLFQSVLCSKLPSVSLRLPSYQVNLFRDLTFPTDFSVCDTGKKANPTDTILGLAKTIRNNPGLLSGDNNTRLNSLIRSDVLNKMNILGLGNTIPTCILGQTTGSMYGSSYYAGGSLSSRNNLRKLFGMNDCTAAFARQSLVSQWIANSSGAALINVLLESETKDNYKVYKYLDAAMGITGERESALGSLALSLSYAYGYNKTYDKLHTVVTTSTRYTLTGKDYMYLKNDASIILSNLDKNVEDNVNNPSERFNTIKSGLDILDPTWNKDDNYYIAKNNETLKNLSTNMLQTKFNNELNLTGTYTTELKPEHYIAIINTFETEEGVA